jgi:peptide/nickel transport system permease protein
MIMAGGLVLGSVAALRGGKLDAAVLVGTTVGLSTPSFVTAILLIEIFAVWLGWFPVFGSGEGLLDSIYHLILPASALALALTAVVARISRSALREELGREHVATAVSRGLTGGEVFRRHVFRNALIPVVTVGGLTVASLLGTTVIIESVFQLNGLGLLLLESVQNKDFAIVQAVALILVAAFVVLNTATDVLYGLLDPRVSTGARSRP